VFLKDFSSSINLLFFVAKVILDFYFVTIISLFLFGKISFLIVKEEIFIALAQILLYFHL